MALVVARMIAKLEAETTQFHARMTSAEQQLNKWTSATTSGRRGTMMMQQGLQQLAFQATALPGPLGKVAAGLGNISLGSTTVTGVLAAGGEIALIWRAVNGVITDLEKSLIGLNREFATLAGQQAPALLALTAVTGTQGRITDLQQPGFLEKLFGSAKAAIGMQGGAGAAGFFDLLFGDVPTAQQTGRESQIASLQLIKQLQQEILERVREEAKWLQIQLSFQRQFPILSGRAAIGALRGGEGAGFPFAKAPTGEKFAPREFFLQDLVKEGGKTPPPGLDASAIAMESLALMGALQRGGLGGVLGAGGGLATALGAGAVFGPLGAALGGVFDLFDRSEERRQREQMEELRRIRQNTDRRGEPRNISLTVLVNGREVSAAILGDVIYGIQRLEHTNATPILPPG